MKLIRNIWLLLMVLITSSCSLFELNENDSNPPDSVVLSHHDIDMMVGDSVLFNARTYPDTAVVSYRWQILGDSEVGKLIGKWFHAKSPGTAYVKVEAQNIDLVNDSVYSVADVCVINVFDWTEGPNDIGYLYETVVYASLEIDGQDLTGNIDGLHVVAVVKNEIREHAQVLESNGVKYLQFRIGSHWPGETATIECYHPELHQRFVLHELVLNGGTYGYLSDLVKLIGYSKD